MLSTLNSFPFLVLPHQIQSAKATIATLTLGKMDLSPSRATRLLDGLTDTNWNTTYCTTWFPMVLQVVSPCSSPIVIFSHTCLPRGLAWFLKRRIAEENGTARKVNPFCLVS